MQCFTNLPNHKTSYCLLVYIHTDELPLNNICYYLLKSLFGHSVLCYAIDFALVITLMSPSCVRLYYISWKKSIKSVN
jgi:hypothetical protein